MTVQELYNELGKEIEAEHGDLRVIANCDFVIKKGNGEYSDFHLTYLNDVYYQSGDIELRFSDRAYD